MFQLLNIEIIDIHIKIAQINKLIDKITKDLDNSVGIDIVSLFIDYYTTKFSFAMIKFSTKLEKKLDSLYSIKYNKAIEKDRYREDDTSNTIGVNLPNNNTQVIDLCTVSKWCVKSQGYNSQRMSLIY